MADVFISYSRKDKKFARRLEKASEDGTARLWNMRVDYDFPKEHLSLLVEVVTGTATDDLGNVTALDPEKWLERKKKYIKIAEKHLNTCKYKDANIYARQKLFWEGKK